MKIFVDMDGVCCNWMLAAMTLNDRESAYDDFRNLKIGSEVECLKTDEFWRKLGLAGESWWYNLEELPHYKAMIAMLKRHGDMYYLTSVPHSDSGSHAASGKCNWIKKREGNDFRNFVFTYHKHLCADANSILIDDTLKQCTSFHNAGGQSVLFPQPWNGFKPLSSHDVIAYLTAAILQTKVSRSDKVITPDNIMF